VAVYDISHPYDESLFEYSEQHLKELVTNATDFLFLRALLGLSTKFQKMVFHTDLGEVHADCLLDLAWQPTQLALRQKVVPLLYNCQWELCTFFEKKEDDEDHPINPSRLVPFKEVATREMIEIFMDDDEEDIGLDVVLFAELLKAVNMHWKDTIHQSLSPTCHTVIFTILLCAQRFKPELPSELWFDFILSRFQVNDFLVAALEM
jgi:hypothetical protein